MAEAIIFLLSDKSKMLNGITMPVDGGFCAVWCGIKLIKILNLQKCIYDNLMSTIVNKTIKTHNFNFHKI